MAPWGGQVPPNRIGNLTLPATRKGRGWRGGCSPVKAYKNRGFFVLDPPPRHLIKGSETDRARAGDGTVAGFTRLRLTIGGFVHGEPTVYPIRQIRLEDRKGGDLRAKSRERTENRETGVNLYGRNGWVFKAELQRLRLLTNTRTDNNVKKFRG